MNTLKDHFLLAMPGLQDPYFSGSLTYLCEHSSHGALGLIVNKPLELSFGDLIKQMGLQGNNLHTSIYPVYRGGPLHQDRGFVLHTGAPSWKSSLPVNDHLSLTTSVDILEALAKGEGPADFLVALGCAGWEEGQLEQELLDNAWLTCPATTNILFTTPNNERLHAAAASLGVNLSLMPGRAGHA